MAEDKGNVVLGTKIGQPIPAEYAFNNDGNIIEVGKVQLEKKFRIGFDVLVDSDFSFVIYNAYIHFSSVQVDSAVVIVLLVVEFHSLASFG